MNLKRFCPNRTLLWKDWKNSWLLFALFFGFVTYSLPITLLNLITTYLAVLHRMPAEYHWQFLPTEVQPGYFLTVYTRLMSGDPWVGIVAVLFTVALAATAMGQERERETFGLLLAMPYSRQDILHSKAVTGLAQLLIIFVLNALLMSILVFVNPGIPLPFSLTDIWAWALHSFLVLTYIFCFTLVIAAISGTTLGNGILAIIFLFFPVGLLILIETNLNLWLAPMDMNPAWLAWWNLRNILSDIAIMLSVPLWLIDFRALNAFAGVNVLYGALAALSVGAYALSLFIFSRNPLENNGEILVFEQLEGFFKLGVAVCFALTCGPLFTSLLAIRHPEPVALIISYLLAGGITWFLTGRLLEWRRAK